MKTHVLSVISLSFALIAGCGDGGSEPGGDGGGGGGPNLTTTVTFEFDDFTGVSVVGPFSVSIVPGPFSIQVTVDSGLHRRLDVREEGRLLIVGFESGADIDSQTQEVVITMPTLASISLSGATFGTISDFNDSVLNVHLAGVAVLEAQNLRYDFLMADVAGVSILIMKDVSPLPAANLNVAGVSSATVNMMDNAVLTGRVEGIATLSYYGSNLTIDVFIEDKFSSVRRLGDSRP